jgi:hypothetical protein
MFESGNSFEDKTSDSFINEAIKETLETLKITPPKFQAVFEDGSTVNFDLYEEAIDFLSKNPNCKVFVK